MRRRKKGTLRSGRGGKGGKVKSRKQAIAIGLSEARKKGAKVPRKRSSRKRSSHRPPSGKRPADADSARAGLRAGAPRTAPETLLVLSGWR